MGLNKWTLADSYVFVKRRRPTVKLSDKILFALLMFEQYSLGQSVSDQPRTSKQNDDETTSEASSSSVAKKIVPSLPSLLFEQHYDTLFHYCQQQFASGSPVCTFFHYIVCSRSVYILRILTFMIFKYPRPG